MESLSAVEFDTAFAEFQVFGPRRRIPIEERWREVLPRIPPANYPSLKQRCKDIEAFAFALAERVQQKSTTSARARMEIAEKYPELTSERLEQTWNQAMIFASK